MKKEMNWKQNYIVQARFYDGWDQSINHPNNYSKKDAEILVKWAQSRSISGIKYRIKEMK